MSSIERVMAKWRADNVCLLPPCDEGEVIEVLSSFGQLLSRDVIDLYCATGGMPDGEMDSLCFSLWPLDRVAAENAGRRLEGILFADFLINSHVYLFRYQDAEASSVHVEYGTGEGPQQVAGGLGEFFELYLNRPAEVGL